jgi:hypothetical protein
MAGSIELRRWRHKPPSSWGAVKQAEVEGEYGATVVRRDRENQLMDKRLERASLFWNRSANSHTGPRHVIAAAKAGHMSAPDPRVIAFQRFSLLQRGRPHMSITLAS